MRFTHKLEITARGFSYRYFLGPQRKKEFASKLPRHAPQADLITQNLYEAPYYGSSMSYRRLVMSVYSQLLTYSIAEEQAARAISAYMPCACLIFLQMGSTN
jgi:hypothetical protein